MHNCSSCFRRNDVTEESSVVNCGVDTLNNRYLPRNSETRFYCCGSPSKPGAFLKRHGMYTTSKEWSSSITLAIEADENENFDVEVLEPKVPYIEEIPVDLHVGRSIEIYGRILLPCYRFSVNFSTGKENDSDIALHINPRLDRRIVVRNHRICNKWGVEEIISVQPFPFRPGKCFSILLLVADNQFMISINKIHYCAFTFRIPIEKISHLIITGDVSLTLIQYATLSSYPPQIFKKKPYIIVPRTWDRQETKCNIRRKIHCICPGTRVEIFGRLKLLPRGFYVNLQRGIKLWPHPLIPFHMNLRLNQPGMTKREREIIFNSWLGGWNKETIITLCPFFPGEDFRIVIDCNESCYLVEVNDKFLYKHQRVESTEVDTVFIYGDVIISKVVLRRLTTT